MEFKEPRRVISKRKPVVYKMVSKKRKRVGGFRKGNIALSRGPTSMTTTLVAVHDSTVNEAGVVYAFTITPNSCFDPFAAEGAQQPNGFSQYKALYGQFKVTAVAADIDIRNNVAASDIWCCIYSTWDSTSKTNLDEVLQQPGVVWKKCLNADQDRSQVSFRNIKHYPKQILGAEFYDNDAVGTDVANPSRLTYMHIVLRSTSANLTDVDIMIRLRQRVTMSRKLTTVV